MTAHFFDTNAPERPIYISTRSFISAVDEDGVRISEWEATDNFSTDLTLEEAEALIVRLSEAVAGAKAFGL